MWPFSNPLECKVAEQCLAQGNPLEAARVLLAAKQPEHRAVRALLLRIGPHLATLGRQAAADNDILIAAELLEVAAQCGSLPPADETLRRQLVERREQLARDRQWREQRLDRAAQWARDGRLRSAIGLVDPLDTDPEAARRRRDWQFDLETLERYVHEFETHLQSEDLAAAAVVLNKAHELAPLDPKVWTMRQTWAKAAGKPLEHPATAAVHKAAQPIPPVPLVPPGQSVPPVPSARLIEPVPANRQEQRALNAIQQADIASTASFPPNRPDATPEIVAGVRADAGHAGPSGRPPSNPRSDSEPSVPRQCRIASPQLGPVALSGLSVLGDVFVVTRPHLLIGTPREPGVDLPMSARLHGRHALLVREPSTRGLERWRVIPLGNARVAVNGEQVMAPASRPLVDGDILEFESAQCRWRFRQPLADSATAILDVVRPAVANIALPGGGACEFVALVADRLVIASDRKHGHLAQRGLPGRLTLTPTDNGWRVETDGAPLFADSEQLPAEFTMYADDAGLAQRVVCDADGVPVMFQWSLKMRKGN
jgi:hypothetical protein